MDSALSNHIHVFQSNEPEVQVRPKQPFVIGVAGGTASGKTTVCDMIIAQLHDQRVVLVSQDSFYHVLSEEKLKQVHEYNFDHPDAFNTELLFSCMEKLKSGHAVDIPVYDYKSHKNHMEPARQVNPSDVIILEGILVLHDPRVRDLMNMKIFVDTDSDVRLARRIQRDTVERGRDIQSVLDQYAKFVKPGFDDFILPSKKHADIIIPRGGDNDVAVDLIVQHICTKLGQHDLCKIYPKVFVIHSTFQIRGMHTLIRDVKTRKHDFVFYADRLIRLVVEHGLGHLPFTEKQITTPTGSVYSGVTFFKRLCGVSIIRSGESMENALRACCKGIKIGKILIHREGNSGRQLIYEKLPADISGRHVLLLDPVLASGNSAVKAISLLISKGVPESNIIFLNLIASPEGIHVVCKKFPKLQIVTSEIDVSLNTDLHSNQHQRNQQHISCNLQQERIRITVATQKTISALNSKVPHCQINGASETQRKNEKLLVVLDAGLYWEAIRHFSEILCNRREHLKLLTIPSYEIGKLLDPAWKSKHHTFKYRNVQSNLKALTLKIQELRRRVALEEMGNVEYHALIRLRQGRWHLELGRAHLVLGLRYRPDHMVISFIINVSLLVIVILIL
ncbi:hypothetical protein NE237_006856 [Protea cynaroides]|uniref:Uridine kinase n=1 Tax=Protea cynaroides TaxID=273540 RepID=A0A9Q0KNA5_9MAGN|nr:hypothetical protein NE237_006856 [Protea cynaroides]